MMTLCCHSCVMLARSHPPLSLCFFFWEVGFLCHSPEARPSTSDIPGVTLLLRLIACLLMAHHPPMTTTITVTKAAPGASWALNPEVTLGSWLL